MGEGGSWKRDGIGSPEIEVVNRKERQIRMERKE